MKLSPALWLLLIAATVAFGVSMKRAGAAEAESKARSDSLDAVSVQLGALAKRYHADSTRHVEEATRWVRQSNRERGRMDSLRAVHLAETPRIDTLLLTVSDTVREAVQHALGTLEGEVGACRATLANLDSLSTGCALRLRDANRLILATDSLLTATQAAYQVERKRASPGLVTRAVRGLPWLAAGLVLGIVVK